ncbi:VOC family protein [Leucobacter allii]|uniref:VOC family protein n=1 Tax=Leucobacter allii TaxID=2932247 RepID=A0ABY4FHT3_9MICO|nr:VOC family protein [Leucobacter allii]UOQ56209.1 VOC family protein [Leucobacter allii]
MPSSLATYIALPGNTAEAMEYWHSVFGGDLVILRYGDMQLEGMPFEPDPEAVAHATLTLPVGVIAGSDVMDTREYPIRDTAYSLLYTTETDAEAKRLYDALIAGGGTVGMPLEVAPWGDLYGQVFDRFGVMWSFSCEHSG